MKKTIVLLLIIALCGCEKKQDPQSKIFNTYLTKTFNTSIPGVMHYYLIIPKLGCAGCVEATLQEINTFLSEQPSNDITIITSRETLPAITTKVPILYDTSGLLDVLNLNIYNVCIVQTKNHRVSFIKPIQMNETDCIRNLIKS